MLTATPHDGKGQSVASLMNMLDPTAIADEENYTKDVLKSAKDSKIYNILGKKRLKQIFPSWKGGIERSKDEMIRESERMLESMSLKTDLHERACQLLGYILMNE